MGQNVGKGWPRLWEVVRADYEWMSTNQSRWKKEKNKETTEFALDISNIKGPKEMLTSLLTWLN
jgi:hypothetical protein